MLFHLLSSFLGSDNQTVKVVYFLAIFGVYIFLPFVIGKSLARRFRMQDYGWKIGVMLMTVLLGAEIMCRTWDPKTNSFDIKLGVDLKGGVILIYEVEEGVQVQSDPNAPSSQQSDDDQEAEDAEIAFSMNALVEALSRRINPSGTKEIVIRK